MCINACIWQCWKFLCVWSYTWMMTCDSTSFIWIEMYTMTYESFGNCIYINSWLHANLQECLEITCVWTHLHDDIWQGSEIAWMRPWINAYIWPYFIYACVNMYIHRSMWLFSKTALIWTCVYTLICDHIQNLHGCGCALKPHAHINIWLFSETSCVYMLTMTALKLYTCEHAHTC